MKTKAKKVKSITPPLKWHGGKSYLASKIIGLMPPRCKNPNAPDPKDKGWLRYVEPYFGGGQVMLANDPEGISEVANDLNANLVNFWEVLAGEGTFVKFCRIVAATPFSELRWAQAHFARKIEHRTVRDAVDFFVHCRQSLSGRMKGFAGITRARTRRGMNEQVSAWLNVVEGLPEVHARLKRVLILNKPAVEVIEKEDGPRTLFYVDAPYVHSSRVTTGEYANEMTDEQHLALIDVLLHIKGRALVSMYHHPIYDVLSDKYGWRLAEFLIDNKASGARKKQKKTECVWMNYSPEGIHV